MKYPISIRMLPARQLYSKSFGTLRGVVHMGKVNIVLWASVVNSESYQGTTTKIERILCRGIIAPVQAGSA